MDICHGLIEAAWLTAAIVVPLLYNPHSRTGFHPNKTAIVRLLAAITAVAWAIKPFLNAGFPREDRLPARPVMIALAFLLGGSVLATLFSINPQASVWGESESGQGLITTLSESIFFLAIACHLRCVAQVERLVTALVATSIPVALYGIIQRAGFDPIVFDVSTLRSTSTLGHPIFLAAYLAMIMPLTWWKILREAKFHLPSGTRERRAGHLLFYGGVAIVQLISFFCAQSRGPLLGLTAMATIFALGWTFYTRQWKWLRVSAAIIGIFLTLLLFLNLPLPISARVAGALGMERFANTVGLRNGPDPYRKAHWEAGIQLMTSRNPISFPDGGSDPWCALRPWIGYGPETLENVLPQRFIWATTNVVLENRFHNRVLDLWYATGALGTLAFFAFSVLIWEHGARSVGLGLGKLDYLVIPGLAMAGGALSYALADRAFAGLGLILGSIAGCGLSILATNRVRREAPAGSTNVKPAGILIIALLASLAGHVIETGFAFTVPATSLLFWFFAAMVLAVTRLEDSNPDAVTAVESRKPRRGRSSTGPRSGIAPMWDVYLASCGPALILVTLLFGFIQIYATHWVDWAGVLSRTLTEIKGNHAPSHLIWLLFIPTWLATNFAFVADADRKLQTRFLISTAISAATGAAFAIFWGAQISRIGPVPTMTASPENALAQISGYHYLYFSFIAVAMGILFVVALILTGSNAPGAAFSLKTAGAILMTTAIGVGAAWFLALRDIRADVTNSWGLALLSLGRLEAGTEVLRRAVLEKPGSIDYRRSLAGGFVQQAQATDNPARFAQLSREAEAALLPAAAQAHGLSIASLDMARLYMRWAALTPEADQRLLRTNQAAEYFRRLRLFLPGNAASWLDEAVLDQEILHQPEEAERKLRKAMELMRNTTEFWANSSRHESLDNPSPDLRHGYAEIAKRLFDAVIRETPAQDYAALRLLRVQKAGIEVALGDLGNARKECLEALPAQSSSSVAELWRVDAMLAEIDLQMGNRTEANELFEKAIKDAPPEKQAVLRARKSEAVGY